MSPGNLAVIEQYQTVLLDAAWRGAIVLLVAFSVTRCLRRKSASLRHLIWTGAVLTQLALPLLALWGPRWAAPVSGRASQVLSQVPLQQALAQQAEARRLASVVVEEPRVIEAASSRKLLGDSGATSQNNASDTSRSTFVAIVLSAVWLTGVLFVLIRLCLGTIFTARLVQRAGPMRDGAWLVAVQELSAKLGIRRPIKLFRTNALELPLTWGIVYPVVMLPSDAGEWNATRRNLVLVHEMSHISRVDALSQLVAQLALAMFWFDPLPWLANRRMRIERELACDDLVLQHGTKASHYAAELLEMVQRIDHRGNRGGQPAFAALAMARRTDLEVRLRSILSVDRARPTAGRINSVAGAVAAFAIVAPIATLEVYQSTAPNCAKCEIYMSVVATLTSPNRAMQLHTASQVKRGSNGHYYVSNVGTAFQIAIFDSTGKFLRAVSGRGKERGQYNESMRFHLVGTADTLLLVDAKQNLHVHAPNGDYVRTVHLPVYGWSLIMLRDGRFVAQENIENNPAGGFSFHLLTPNGTLIRSFGPLLHVNDDYNATAVSRPLTLGKNGEIIATYTDRYRVEQWDTTGRLVRATEPMTDWFAPHDPQQPHFQAGNASFDGEVYWTQAGIRRKLYSRQAIKSMMEARGLVFKSPPMLVSNKLTRVQAVEPRTGVVLGSADIRDVYTGSLDNGWLYKRYDEGNVVSRIEIVRAALGEPSVVRK
ncbi:MAG: M56 family metallopeptidase [Gemmatimonadaceae bacterium]